MLQNKVSKLISLRFAESTDPVTAEALIKLQDVEGASFNEVWEARAILLGVWYRCCQQYEDVAGEYVPLAEYQELKTHMVSLARESYELKGLIRRVLNFSPSLLIDDCFDSDGEWYQKLKQLFNDCQEALL